jgi:glycosyltransferase involved in cell wall biosynthesis
MVAKYTAAQNVHLLGGALYLCWQRGVTGWLESWQPDVLIVEANPRYLATPAAVRWMHERGRVVIAWGLGAPASGGTLAGVRQKRRRQYLKQFEALISYSQRGAEEYADLGYPAERIFIAANAAASRPATKPPARPASFSGMPRILFVGRLQERKRVDNLLRACAALPKPIQPSLVIVGDGPVRAELEALARKVYPHVEFAGEHHGAELAPYFTATDLFVLPGTGGLAVQEAMAYGLPVIVARGDGTQDDLVREQNGWQIPPDDLPALTGTLQTALTDVGRLRKMGAESYRIVFEEINLERMVEVFVGVLEQLKTKRQ